MIWFTLFVSQCFAAEPSITTKKFDPLKASKFLDTLSIQLSVVVPSYEILEDAIAKIIVKKEQAEACVIETERELRTFSSDIYDKAKDNQTKHEIYLREKTNELKNHLSECKLIVIRANEAIEVFSAKAKELAASELLTARASIIDNLLHLKDLAIVIYTQFDFNQFYLQTGISFLSPKNILFLLIFMTLGYITGLRLRKIIKARILKNKKHTENVPSILYQALLCVLEEHEIYLIQAVFIAAYFSIASIGMSIVPLGVTFSFVIIGFILYISLIRFLFSPPPPSKSLINIAPEIEKLLISRLKTLGFMLCLAYIVYEALKGQSIPDVALDLPITLFITIVTFNLISVLWLINRTKKVKALSYAFRVCINAILTSTLFGILITNWIGLTELSIYILRGIALSMLSITVFLVLHQIIKYVLLTLSGSESQWQRSLRKKLGLKVTATIPELIWVRIIFYCMTWIVLFLVLLKVWRFSSKDYQYIVNILVDGFHIGNIEIIPYRIAVGLIFTALMMICTRLIKTNVLIREASKAQANKGTIVAFATMLGYLGFTISFFVGAVIAGVNFAGLAIIFGALSVGIGFGLQNIVNNFVSGLILLIERPIKVGDRIIVNNVEGHVKDINIRSTTLRAIKQFDLIVPNSQIISDSVINLMFGDFVYRVSVYVSVAYGSDLKIVRKTLANAAKQHEDVIVDTIEVLLIDFGDHGIKLELRCILSDVDRHVQTTSELHFLVEEYLKEAGITIPFPQRDLHFKTPFENKELPPPEPFPQK